MLSYAEALNAALDIEDKDWLQELNPANCRPPCIYLLAEIYGKTVGEVVTDALARFQEVMAEVELPDDEE